MVLSIWDRCFWWENQYVFLWENFLSGLCLFSSLFPFTYKLLRVRARWHISIWEMYLKEKIHSKLPQPTFSWSSTWHTTHTRAQLPAQESNLPYEKHIRNSSSARQQQLFPTHILKSREAGSASSLRTADQSSEHAGPALSSLSKLYCFLSRNLDGNKSGQYPVSTGLVPVRTLCGVFQAHKATGMGK